MAAGPAKVTPVTTLFVATDKPVGDAQAPWSLTASDGSGLLLTRVDAKAMVEGPLAFTELHLYFHNPESRIREGTFAITLPQGAAVSRFAMESNGQMLEAEVVEKQLARRAYEDFLHRRQDPALLEKAEGNQFSARVFPIAPQADKHLVISFSQEVTPGHYTLPLRGLARAERVDVRVDVRGQNGGIVEQTLSHRDWTPDRDVVVDATSIGAPQAIAADELACARIPVALSNAAEPPQSVTILVDTSASRALGFAAEAHAVEALVGELGRRFGGALPVQVVAFDQVTAPIYDGRADAVHGVETALVARDALGASDLGQAMRWVAGHAAKSRLVVVTDGVITAGAKEDALPALAHELAAHGVGRIDVAMVGGIRDEQAAASLARAGGHAGAVLDLDRGAAEVARRIGLGVGVDLPVAVDGASWVFPRSIASAQSGDEVTVFVQREAQAQQLAISVAGKRTMLSPVRVTPALLQRAAAGAGIAELDGELAKATGKTAAMLRKEIARKSIAARVVSSQTSLLALETDADYARYGIDRSALADILTIGPAGVELTHRASLQIATTATSNSRKGQSDDQPMAHKRLRHNDDDADKSPRDVRKEEKVANKQDASDETGGDDDLSKDSDSKPAKRAMRDPGGPNMQPPPPPATAPAPEPIMITEHHAVSASSSSGMVRGQAYGGGQVDARARDRVAAHAADSEADAAEAPRTVMPARRYAASNGSSVIAADEDAPNQPNDDGLAENRRKPSLTGPLAEIEQALATKHTEQALARARAWHRSAPGDVLALIGLGDALEASRDGETAARVYGSIIDLYPARADFRRFAGERLERLAAARALVIDTYRRAVEERPDHLTGHRLLAYALVRDGQYAAAFAAILDGLDRDYPDGRFAGAERVLSEDAGMIGAAYIAHAADHRSQVLAELAKRHIALPTGPSTRFIMYWETDDNDVDFHIRDARGHHAWYSQKHLASGGDLYADITTGYGPECFAIQGKPSAGPYQLSINYYSQGPMGYGMGLLQIQTFDGNGNLRFEDRPYVIMTNQAFVDLGTYR